MVVMTAKVSKAKLIAVVCILAAVICVSLLLLSDSGNAGSAAAADVNTNESRIVYLASCGWEVDPQPTETQEVLIPEEMNDVFQKYNDLQRSQGFDLSRFSGKKVQRYVYSVTNYEGSADPVYATLLISDGNIIGGDITVTGAAGQMLVLKKSSAPTQPTVPEDATASNEEETVTETTPAV